MTKRQLAQQCRAAAKRVAPSVSFKVIIVGDGQNAAVCVDFKTPGTTAEEKSAIKAAIGEHLQYILRHQEPLS